MYVKALEGMAEASIKLSNTDDARKYAKRYMMVTGSEELGMSVEVKCDELELIALKKAESGLPAGWTATIHRDALPGTCHPRVTYRPTFEGEENVHRAQEERPTRPFVLNGMLASLSGLHNRPDLNGAVGVVGDYVKSSGRYVFVVIGRGSNAMAIKVKVECLIFVRPADVLELASSLFDNHYFGEAQQVCQASLRSLRFSELERNNKIVSSKICNVEGLCLAKSHEHEAAIASFSTAIELYPLMTRTFV
eukprot:COSAG01_NODE_10040_length_2267_cov_1.099631_2_plen_249_part_01